MSRVIALALLWANAERDLRTREIVLWPTLLLLAAGCGTQVVSDGTVSGVGWSLLPGLVLLILSIATRGGIGSGDAVVVGALGIWTGAESAFLTTLFALTLVPTTVVLKKKTIRNKEVPFVPYLFISYVLWLFAAG